jgi:glucose/arabinose dehydrogenase
VLVLGLVSVSAVSAPAASPSIALVQVATGLPMVTSITHAGDGSGRLFITLQTGQILIHDGTQVLPTPFLDIGSLVACCSEQGLLSVAFHPNYASNGYFYVNYTATPSGSIVIARYRVSANPNIANPSSAMIVLTIPHPTSAFHNGGQLQFGSDGYLYISVGDGGTGGGPAQDLGILLGKILRIDVDGGTPYAIPPTNPFLSTPGALPEIWAWGLRNPWRFSFDRLTGDLFIADVGEETREEVNFQPATSPGGENYGWPLMEGTACFNPPAGCNDGTLTLPILEYVHNGDCAITGGYRYRGSQFAALSGLYFYGDLCSGQIWGASQNGSVWTTTPLLDSPHTISTFGEDEGGELYVAHYSGAADGAISRIVSTAPTLAFTGEVGYISDGMEPNSGSPSTTFTFRVKYTEPTGSPPQAGSPKVHILNGRSPIPGSPFAMALASGTPATGAIYTLGIMLSAGSYSHRFEAADSNGIPATGPPTSTQAGPTVSTVGTPDLVVIAVSDPPAAAGLGGSFAVTDTVQNQGTSGAGASTTRYYIGTSPAVKTKLLTGTRALPALGVGATSTGTVTVTISTRTSPGTYFLLACADDLQQVSENSETNNCRPSATTVSVAP